MPVSDNQASTWEEPPWSGFIETTGDALLILEAARRGLIPRVTRRLVDAERKMITSGSVFVFDEEESGIKRWTDGFYWSPSRILGNFLLYRETDKRGGSRGSKADSGSVDAIDAVDGARENSLSRSRMDDSRMAVDKHIERNLLGSLTNSYKFKPDGLMKKTFSLAIGGVSQHLISYYRIEDVTNGRLRSPSSLPEIASLDISPEYLDKTHFRSPPKVEVGIDGVPRYRGEADDIDTSPAHLTGPLSTGLPLITTRPAESRGRKIAGPSKSAPRFEPYSGQPSTSVPKNKRRQDKTTPEPPTPIDPPQSQEEQDSEPSPTTTAAPSTAYNQPAPAPAPPPAQPPAVVPGAPPHMPMSPPAYPPPYPVPGYYQPPGYPPGPPPHPYVPPNVALQPAPQIHPPPAASYPATPSTSSENTSQSPSEQPQPTYGYPYPPPPQAIYPPPGYGTPWPPYGMYHPPPGAPMSQPPPQPAAAKPGQASGNGTQKTT